MHKIRRRIPFKKDDEEEEKCDNPTSLDDETDSTLPYGPKIILARKKKSDPWYVVIFEISVIISLMLFCVYFYFCFDHFHFHINHFYANLGYSHAQNLIGQKYLQGHGTETNLSLAFHWLKKASDQGHPHASYNLAIGHLDGSHSHLQDNIQAHQLLKHASKNGIPEAELLLQKINFDEDYET